MRFLFLLPLLILTACNASNEKTETGTADSITVNNKTADEAFEAAPLTRADIPETILVEGEVKNVFRWNDKNGDNIFFVSVRGPYPDNDKGEAGEDGRTADIYAFHYARPDSADYRLLWSMHEQELSCPLDITTEVIPGSVTITDLDKNGYAEAKLQYALACRSDVSPAGMTLIMEENKQVFRLDGLRWVEFGPEFKFDVNTSNVNIEKLPMLDDGEDDLLRSYGRYKTEKSFANAPAPFLVFARNEWIKYAIEKFEN